mgnify:CR=1 FL=1
MSQATKPAVLLLHGWPGSIVEFSEFQKLLLEDGHPVIIPCLPGYGFSTAPQKEGFDMLAAGVIFHRLMERLGYGQFLIQAGDWGGLILESMVHLAPAKVLGAYTNFPLAPCGSVGTTLSVLMFDGEQDQALLAKSTDFFNVSVDLSFCDVWMYKYDSTLLVPVCVWFLNLFL